MARKRLYKSEAEKSKAYRERKKLRQIQAAGRTLDAEGQALLIERLAAAVRTAAESGFRPAADMLATNPPDEVLVGLLAIWLEMQVTGWQKRIETEAVNRSLDTLIRSIRP